jgi:hypothetical protein
MAICRRCGAYLTSERSIRAHYGSYCVHHKGEPLRPRGLSPEIGAPQHSRVPAEGSRRAEPTGGGFVRAVAIEGLKSAVVGASCVTFPPACAAIVVVAKTPDLLDMARKVVGAVRHSRSTGGKLRPGARVVAQSLTESLVSESVEKGAQPVTALAAAAIVSSLPPIPGVPGGMLQRLATRTISDAMAGGMGRAAEWGVSEGR